MILLALEDPPIEGCRCVFACFAIIKAWKRLKESGKLEKVLHIFGNKTKHYALTNHKEFFAEFTEAYFGVNDFYPFVYGELKEFDPETFKLFEEIWGKRRR